MDGQGGGGYAFSNGNEEHSLATNEREEEEAATGERKPPVCLVG